ncbi:MAG: S9 family peptidase [Chloroflexi bacterium]|nr:S9 family peptidase [Chloroflexota bacterium]
MTTSTSARKFSYPPTRRDAVVEQFHGTAVADPYRWLEDPHAADTQAFVAAQNELTRGFIDELPLRAVWQQRLTALWDYPKVSPPEVHAGRLFFQRNDGLQNQAVLYRQDGPDGRPTPLLDPNTLSQDGTIALINQSYTEDGRYLAYSLSISGSDWQDIRVRDTETGQDTGDHIQWCKFTNAAWLPDNSGFFYARYPAPGELPDAPPSTHQRVYFHRLGAPQTDDVLVYARPDAPELGFMAQLTDDGRYLLLTAWDGTDPRNRFYYCDLSAGRDLSASADFVRLIDEKEAKYDFLTNDGPVFYFVTDLDAPNGRIIAIDVSQPDRANWREIVPEGEDVVETAVVVHDELIIDYLHHAHHRLSRHTLDGAPQGDITLPAIGSVALLTGRRHHNTLYFVFQSFLYPPTVFRYDFATQELAAWHQPQVTFDSDAYETTQVFYPSKDGTRVPMFLTHKKGLPLDGNNPTLLYGYGGFNLSLPPLFAPTRLAWLEQGGVYAQANLRGGTEYGEAWHQAGMLGNKQNVFDDFIAAAEWLIANGYTHPDKLAIEGRSNGGLLVAACLLQRPDLYGAVHCGVPVIDMLRYHKFTAGRYWTSEYGNAEENPEHFRFMMAYSPLHNVQDGVSYPPTLITTAETDDRVVPLHAEKFTATLQAADAGNNPLLLRVETKAGHGLGKPTGKLIEEAADVYSFLWTMLHSKQP